MPNLQIITVPNPLLKEKSEDVKEFDQILKNTIRNMYDTLYSSGNGIGLAAPQVGIMKRIVVIDIKEKEKSNPITFINPKIVKKSKETFVTAKRDMLVRDPRRRLHIPNISRPHSAGFNTWSLVRAAPGGRLLLLLFFFVLFCF